MESSVGQPLTIKIPVNNDMVQRAFEMLKDRCIHRNEDKFDVFTRTINHSEIDEGIRWILERYQDTSTEFKRYIERIKFNNEGQQFAKAIVIGTTSRFSVSIIATNRIRTGVIDQHTVLIATATKTVEMLPRLPNVLGAFNPVNLLIGLFFPWYLLVPLFGITVDNALTDVLRRLNEEESKKCLEAMTFYILGNKIQQLLGAHVNVQFIEQ